MISQRKLEANRRNARKSHGPKTAAGKKRVSRNALKHGLTSYTCPVLPFENEWEYRELAEATVRDLHPVGIVQREVVNHIILVLWKLRRIPKIEAELVNHDAGLIEKGTEEEREEGTLEGEPDLSVHNTSLLIAAHFLGDRNDRAYERLENYRMRLERCLQAALRQLEALRKQTAGEEISKVAQLRDAMNEYARMKRELDEMQAKVEKLKKQEAEETGPAEPKASKLDNPKTNPETPSPARTDHQNPGKHPPHNPVSQINPTDLPKSTPHPGIRGIESHGSQAPNGNFCPSAVSHLR